MFANLEHRGFFPLHMLDRQIFHSLRNPLSTIQGLVISYYEHPRRVETQECPIFQTLSSTNNLRTLTLIERDIPPFILALDPNRNPSQLVLCPNLKELVIYIESLGQFNIKRLVNMAKNRALRGAKLSSVTFVELGGRRGRSPESGGMLGVWCTGMLTNRLSGIKYLV